MEGLKKLCPGVTIQLLRQTEAKKMAFGLSQGDVLLFCLGGKLRFAASGKSVMLNPGCFCLLSDEARRML